MPTGKAVGEGGFHIELLRAADDIVLRLFYDVMMDDLVRGVVPDNWHVILYAMLVKPPPNNPRLLGQRREIALMASDMKICLHMLRTAAYSRIQLRLCSDQVGWCAGYGTGDVGIRIQCAIQQARRLQHPLYILYLDLAQFFPRICRKIGTIGELLYGMPSSAAMLVLLIYGGFDGKPPARCRIDTAAGLTPEFGVYLGWLMGCVLSPDKAKIFLDTCLVAMRVYYERSPTVRRG